MQRARVSLPFFLAAILVAGSDLEAQSGQPGLEDVVSQEIEVLLAEIEVVVTDHQGRSVTGLAKEEFEVLQDGRPVELTHFRAINEGAWLEPGTAEAVVGTTSEATEQERTADPLHLVVYIDRTYLQPGDLRDVRGALKGFLRQLGTRDRTMLVTADSSLELRQSFTTVPEVVISQLDAIRERPGGGRFATQYRSLLVDLRRAKSDGVDLGPRDPRLLAEGYFSQIQAFAAEVTGELQRSAGHLSQLVRSITGLPGRRAVLYIGGRVPAAYSRSLFESWDEAFGRNSDLSIPNLPNALAGDDAEVSDTGDQLAQDRLTFNSLAAASAVAQVDDTRLIEEVARFASAHGVVFHTLDAASLRGSASTFSASGDAILSSRGGSGRPTPAFAPGSLADSLSSLAGLARGTGGRAFTGNRNFTAALASMGRDLSTYYSLGFEPLATDKESSRIKVRLRQEKKGRKLKVRHRPLLRVKDRDTQTAERTLSALLLEELENPLQVALTAGEPIIADGTVGGTVDKKTVKKLGKGALRVPVSVTIPLANLALVADGRVHTGRLSVFAVSGGLDRVGTVTKAVVPVRIPNRDLLTSLGRRVAYQLELTVPSGPQRIAVTVRDDFRPLMSTVTMSWVPGSTQLGELTGGLDSE